MDCSCVTRVYRDGNVEIKYCALHEAAPELLDVLYSVRREVALPSHIEELIGDVIRKAEEEK